MTRLVVFVLVPIAVAVLLAVLFGDRPDPGGWAPVTCPRCHPVQVELP